MQPAGSFDICSYLNVSAAFSAEQWYHDLNLFSSPIKDSSSNSTTSAQGHKTDQETSNTHSDYEWSTNIDLDDIFISVKTTKKFHTTRLKAIVKTWFQLARDQVSRLSPLDYPLIVY